MITIIFLDIDNADGKELGGTQFEAGVVPRAGEEVKLYSGDDLIAGGVVVKVEYAYWKDSGEIVYVMLRLATPP